MTANFPKSIKILLFIVLSYLILVHAKPFLVPIAFAGLFSMLLLPVSRKLESWHIKKGISIVLSILMLVVMATVVVWLLSLQISDIKKNADGIEKNISEKIMEVRNFANRKLGISQQDQNEIIQKQKENSGNRISNIITGSISSIGAAVTNLLLLLVYMFLFMYFRRHLQQFVLQLVPREKQSNALDVIQSSRRVAQKYLSGLALMIVSLWIMYSIGFSIVGVKNALFFAILCGLLEIVPFVGNITGTAITILLTLAQGGSMQMILGIVVVYAIVQFVQTYFLEPLVVGKNVNVHPVFTIIGIVAGEFVWGIPGMILALPILGVIKIICDHVEALKPYGFLIGQEREGKGGLVGKVKKLFGKKR
ncbi:MAG: AI-2E family transporter [Bacteroidota bacterium]